METSSQLLSQIWVEIAPRKMILNLIVALTEDSETLVSISELVGVAVQDTSRESYTVTSQQTEQSSHQIYYSSDTVLSQPFPLFLVVAKTYMH